MVADDDFLAWWNSGGMQNSNLPFWRSIVKLFAFIGVNSIPNAVSSINNEEGNITPQQEISTTALEIGSFDGLTRRISVQPGGVNQISSSYGCKPQIVALTSIRRSRTGAMVKFAGSTLPIGWLNAMGQPIPGRIILSFSVLLALFGGLAMAALLLTLPITFSDADGAGTGSGL